MKYKSYTGHVEYDDEAKIFHGEVLGIKDVVTFQGTLLRRLNKHLKTQSTIIWPSVRREVKNQIGPSQENLIYVFRQLFMQSLVFRPS